MRPALGLFAQDGIGQGNHVLISMSLLLLSLVSSLFIDAADFSGQEYGETAQ